MSEIELIFLILLIGLIGFIFSEGE